MREIQEESVSTYRIDSPPPSHTSSPTSSPLPSSPLHPRHGIIQHQSDHTRPLHPRPFRVIIIGGSIAGLTLANCLAAAGIEYLVLEKHQSINAPLGGLIGIAPTGARILDQLGIYDAVKDIGQEITVLRTGFPDGSGFNQTWVAEFEKRYGYGISVTSRQQLLEVLYTALGPSASETVHLGKEVTNIHHEGSGVKVLTRDGMTYFGDLVAGADGVHSIARSEMLRMAGGSASNEESELSAEYRIHVGLSCPVPTITPGEQIVRCYDGFAVFALCGKDGILGWFITEKLDRRYQYPNRPNHTQNDAIKFCESLADVPVWGDVTFGAIWKARTSISHALVEENVFKTWNYGRIVCIGDSVIKTSPNSGLGASLAMEGAAALANNLRRLISSSESRPSLQQIQTAFRKQHRDHRIRMRVIEFASHKTIRLHCRDGWYNSLMGRVSLRSSQLAVFGMNRFVNSGVKLEFLPVPQRGVVR